MVTQYADLTDNAAPLHRVWSAVCMAKARSGQCCEPLSSCTHFQGMLPLAVIVPGVAVNMCRMVGSTRLLSAHPTSWVIMPAAGGRYTQLP